jgi:hypothetical protein
MSSPAELVPDPSSIGAQWQVVAESPLVFFLAVVAAAGVIWAAIHWAYHTRLESKDSQIDLLRAQLEAATLKKGFEDAAPDKAAETIKQLEMRLREIEPRCLSQTQKQSIGKFVRKHSHLKGNISLTFDGISPEAKKFAAELALVLSQGASMKVNQVSIVQMPGGLHGGSKKGLRVAARDMSVDAAKFIAGALDVANIDYDVVDDDPQLDFADAVIAVLVRTG